MWPAKLLVVLIVNLQISKSDSTPMKNCAFNKKPIMKFLHFLLLRMSPLLFCASWNGCMLFVLLKL